MNVKVILNWFTLLFYYYYYKLIDSITDDILKDRYNHQKRAQSVLVDINIIHELEEKGLVIRIFIKN